MNVDLVRVEVAVQVELVLRGLSECEICLPILSVLFGQGDGLFGSVELCPISTKRVIHHLKDQVAGIVADHKVPSIFVGDERLANLAVYGIFLDVPDSVERRFGRRRTVLVPPVPGVVNPQTEKDNSSVNDLDCQSEASRSS